MLELGFFHRERVKQRLILYHGVMPIFMEFTDDVEETFKQALKLLLVNKIMILWFYADSFIWILRGPKLDDF